MNYQKKNEALKHFWRLYMTDDLFDFRMYKTKYENKEQTSRKNEENHRKLPHASTSVFLWVALVCGNGESLCRVRYI